ncbi:uncharacterized protein LOC128442272 isoform X3 [Pleuronectes platessa]|uniref:uncharacterized protein LOC128442272 isoform X3 n=1 Tax=Pleuronectes platessa TaxID=8262 RepID=UPI00232A528E|nr:uncharacterized protein LOC128442272 isoform X3 [Pleuronectes platessa]
MKIFCLILLCHGSLQLQCDKKQITAHIGGEFILFCKYDTKHFLYSKKYWCRGESRNTCTILVHSEHFGQIAGRSLVIDGGRRGLIVKVTGLQFDDTGAYWVGIDKVNSDIMTSVNVLITEVPLSKPRLWPLTSLVDGPTCWGRPVTVRCGCAQGSGVRYAWHQRTRFKDSLLHLSSDLNLHCGSLGEDSDYYCVATNALSSQESEVLSVQVLRPAHSDCVYVLNLQGQPSYDCADRMCTTSASTPALTTNGKIHTEPGNQPSLINHTRPDLGLERFQTWAPLWYTLLRWGYLATLLIDIEPEVSCVLTTLVGVAVAETGSHALPLIDACQTHRGFSFLPQSHSRQQKLPGSSLPRLSSSHRKMGLVERFVMDLSSVRLLFILGLVVAAQAQSCSRPVAGANMSLKDSDILLDVFENGAVASFTCSAGYTSGGGSPSITCVDGSWSPVKLICEKKSCGSAGEVPHGNVDYSEGNEFGDQVVVTCDPGYNLVGKPVLRCGDKGWQGRLPICEAITCDPPQQIENGVYSPKKEDFYGISEVIQYSCQKPYSLRGAKSLTCSENGAFKPAPPECIIVNCEDPVVEFGKFLSGSRPPHLHLASVTFECITGYYMVGERTQTCDINGNWSPGLPTCKLSPTTKATTTTTTTKATTTTTSGKQTAATKPTDAPDSGSDSFTKYGVPILAVAGAIIIALIIYWIIKRILGSQRSIPDSEAPKLGEEIPLSK